MKLVCRTLGWVPWIRIWVGATFTHSSLDLFGDSFVLLTVPDQTERWRKAADNATTGIEVIGVGSDVVDLHGDFRKLCRIKDGAVLVRPDGYIMWSSPDAVADPERKLAEIFERIPGFVTRDPERYPNHP